MFPDHRLDPDDAPRHDEASTPVGVRIGELSRRVGVSTELLRAWERRYQLLRPARSPKGYRLYAPQDELRVRVMQEQIARGLSAAEAAVVARRAVPFEVASVEPPSHAPGPAGSDVARRHYRALQRALDAYDESAAQELFDAMLRELSLMVVLRDVVLPYLAELGARWDAGTVDVAQEHFASNLIRGRLALLALGWGHGVGPRAVLACPQGELHDLPMMIFGIALNRRGWRVTFLGNDTPVSDLDSAARHLDPQVVVLAATTSGPFESALEGLRLLAERVPVVVAGAGATERVVASTGAIALRGDPVTEAMRFEVPRLSVGVGAGA